MNVLLDSTLIFLTVALSLSLGVMASYVALRAVLYAFGRRAPKAAPAMMTQAHAAGD